MCYEKVCYFYYLIDEYNHVYVNAESLEDASAIADSFNRKTGAIIVGICPEFLLNTWYHE